MANAQAPRRRHPAAALLLCVGALVVAASAAPAPAQIARTKTDQMLIAAHKAVFPLKIRTDQTGVFARGMAFFVSADGYALTSFHSLRGAPGAFALLEGEPNPVPVELISVEPGLNLALIRVAPETLTPPRNVPFIPVAEEAPASGEVIWLLSRSRFGRPQIDSGTFETVITHANLPEETRMALATDNFSHWVQTGIKVTIENSGGPIINGKGELLGMASYVWESQTSGSSRGGAPTRFVSRDSGGRGGEEARPATGRVGSSKGLALSAAHLYDILEGRPPSPLSFTTAIQQYAAERTIHTTLPRLDMEPIALSNVYRAANTFRDAAVCPLCKGEGEVVDEAKTKQQQEDARGVQPQTPSDQRNVGRRYDGFTPSPQQQAAEQNAQATQQEPVMKTCPKCTGSGFQQAAAVIKLGGNVVDALARVDMADPAAQEAIVHLNIALVEVLRHNPQRFIVALNNEARKYLHPRVLRVGTPIIFLGSVDDRSTLPGRRGQLQMTMLGDTGPSVIIAEPDLADANPSDVVLVGGVLAGYITDDQGNPIPVLQRGFVITIPEVDEQGNIATSASTGDSASDPRERFRAFMEMRQRYGDRR